MNWLDIAIAFVLIMGALNGATQGLVRQMITLAGIVVGLIVSVQSYQDVWPYLGFIPDKNWAMVATFVIMMLVFVGIAGAVGQAMHRAINTLLFGSFDTLLGGAFGLLQSALLLQVALILLVKYQLFGLVATIKGSTLAATLLSNVPMLLSILPQEAARRFWP
ncbi:MAG: CvpA family protein [Chloroflexi bacterium]|nr:CvpA family protein [Chloroflexota bacterium]